MFVYTKERIIERQLKLPLIDGARNNRLIIYLPCITAFGGARYSFITCFIYEQFGNYYSKKCHKDFGRMCCIRQESKHQVYMIKF